MFVELNLFTWLLDALLPTTIWLSDTNAGVVNSALFVLILLLLLLLDLIYCDVNNGDGIFLFRAVTFYRYVGICELYDVADNMAVGFMVAEGNYTTGTLCVLYRLCKEGKCDNARLFVGYVLAFTFTFCCCYCCCCSSYSMRARSALIISSRGFLWSRLYSATRALMINAASEIKYETYNSMYGNTEW